MFLKLGEPTSLLKIESNESCEPAVDAEVLKNFAKTANSLKKIAPKAEDFLYFSAVMMHAAESSSLHEDGTIKLNGAGKPVEVGWDKTGGTWRWNTNDPSVKPYKNSNGDIFPESELLLAHKKWIGKPLCIDHKSSSVDHVRGFIVDTYYDRVLKRVIALCALDKHNYPDLARKVSTGYSNNVSMGTAVGRAICSDCGTIAKAEADFCKCMRNKTCYGEINVDLNPIELSIVVNGADPKAHIKHIIAAANTLNTYVENKSKELSKLSENSELTNKDELQEGLKQLKADYEILSEKFEKFKNSEKDTNDLAFNQSSGSVAMDEDATTSTDSGLSPPHTRYASVEEDSITQLRLVTSSIEDKLGEMKKRLDKLANTSINIQEENMSGSNELNKKGYFQGTEDPTPGKPKYPVDSKNTDLRENGDKHMDADDTGPVDGMYPGDLEKKKMLARAQAEERAMRREAIVDLAKQAIQKKVSYFQGGGGANEPTPGKTKYPVDKLNDDLRDEDKHMVGQKPFPGVGAVDGMHPSPASADVADEKKRKEMLSRASLRARFIKAANSDGTQNLGKSAWEVFVGDKLVLTASVNDLSGGRTEMLYDTIATKEFGGKLIEKVKVHGASAVLSLVKKAQEMPAAPPAAEPVEPAAEPVTDAGGTGDPKDVAVDLAVKLRDLSSDLVEAVNELTGEQAEMGAENDNASPDTMGVAASSDQYSMANLNVLRKEINGALTHAMKESIAELNSHEQELEMIQGMYDKGAVNSGNAEFVGSLVDDALNEAKTAVADGFKLMTAFVKYARGTKTIVKRAEIEAELNALGEGDTTMDSEFDNHSDDDLMNLINDTNADLESAKADMMLDDQGDEELSNDTDFDMDLLADDNDLNVELKPGEKVPENLPDGTTMSTAASFNSAEGRSVLRAKLAADALGKYDDGQLTDMSKQKFSDMLDEADRLADGQTHLDVKPSENLGKVETLPEVNKEMLDLAKAPPKVRKEAEAIHKLVTEGHLDPHDIDSLVSLGLDKDAVSYYKKYYGETEGGSEFASELVKEHVKAQMEEELNKYRVKLARSYELAYEMVDRGMCAHDRTAISDQVDQIMKFNDDNFDSLKRVVANKASAGINKAAGRMPQVGMIGSSDNNTAAQTDDNLYTQLSAALSKTSNKMF